MKGVKYLKLLFVVAMFLLSARVSAVVAIQTGQFTGTGSGNIPYTGIASSISWQTIPADHFSAILAAEGISYNIVKVDQVIALDYSRANKSDLQGNTWQLVIGYTITNLDNSTSATGYLTVSDKNYTDVKQHNLHTANWRVTINSVTASGTIGNAIKSDINLLSSTEIEYHKLFTTSDIALWPTNTFTISSNASEAEIKWNAQAHADAYELQYIYIDEKDDKYSAVYSNPDLAFDHPEASTAPFVSGFHYKEPVNVVVGATSYKLNYTYPKGLLAYRVRALGRMLDNSEVISYGGWSTTKKHDIIWNFEPDKLWQTVTTFAEEGKHKEVLSYYDGSMRNRQALTNLSNGTNVNELTYSVVAETKYDYEGRPVFTALPAPIPEHIAAYQSSFNQYSSAEYTKSNFDKSNHAAADALALTHGTGKYYSANVLGTFSAPHTHMMNYIPDAEGYAYSQVEYTRDGTGRIRAVGGVGPDHQLGSGKETKYYYATTNDTELKRLFGSNVGVAAHYKKNYILDPNGQVSVSYLDQEGRTIATALAGKEPDNLVKLDSNTTHNVMASLMANNVVDKEKMVSSLDYTIFNPVPNTTYIFKYNIDGVINKLSGTVCKTCVYRLKIYMTDESGSYVKLSSGGGDLDSITQNISGNEIENCAEALDTYVSEDVEFSVSLTSIAEYKLHKELTIGQGELEIFLEWATSALNDAPNDSIIVADYLARIDSSICDLTCRGAFEAPCRATLSTDEAWGTHTEAEQNELVQQCIAEKCAAMISNAIDSISKGECKSYLEQMRQSIQPDQQGVLDYTWWGDSIPPFTITNGTDTVTLDAAALADMANFQEWYMDSLVKYHREYCHYMRCINGHAAKIFEKQLGRSYTLEQAQDTDNNYNNYNFYNIVRGNDLDSLKMDPFFGDAIYGGFIYADDMQNDLLDFKGCTPPVSMEDYFAYSTSRYPCEGGTALTQTNAQVFYAGLSSPADDSLIAVRHWQLMRSTYIALRNEYIAQRSLDRGCPYQTDANAIVDAPAGNLPTTQAEADAFADQNFSNHVGSTCTANIAGWRIAMVNQCSNMTDQEFNDSIAPLLYHYCMGHASFSNPLGLIFASDTLTDPDLIAVQAYLEREGWQGCDTNVLSLNPYAQTIDEHVSYGNGTTGLSDHPTAEYGVPVVVTHTVVTPCLWPVFDYINTAMWQNGAYAWDNPAMPIRSANLGAVSPEVAGCLGSSGHLTVRMPTDPEDEELIFDLDPSSEGCSFAIVFLDTAGNLVRNVSFVSNLAYNPNPSAGGSIYYNVDTFSGYNPHASRLYPANCAHVYADITANVTRNGEILKAWMYMACFEFNASDHLDCATGGECCPTFTSVVTDTIAMGLADTSYTAGVVYTEDYVEDCLANLADQAEYLGMKEYERQYEEYTGQLLATINKCFAQPFDEDFTMSYGLNEYHYTLYYYDQAGILVQTVPPEGVDVLGTDAFDDGVWDGTEPQHRLRSRYSHNSLDAVRWQSTPDAGQSRFWYDWKGMLKMSQNAKQLSDDKYSFTKYDRQGRITAVGELAASTIPPDITRDMLMEQDYLRYFVPTTNPGFMQVQDDYTLTVYDAALSPINTNTRSRVSYSLRAQSLYDALEALAGNGYEFTTQAYGYDIHGNVNTYRQRIPLAGESTIRYKYDLISGKVNSVAYHDGSDNVQMLHRYAYDADNRLRKVETSRKGLLWHTDAEYWYYPHGPLARVEIGEDHVQGMDYCYTIHGWLKGINNVAGDYNTDPGKDGAIGNHSMFAPDQYALTLNYYAGDYTQLGGTTLPYTHASNWSDFTSDLQGGIGLYNGNIAWQANSIGKNFQGTHPFGNGATQSMVYKYDQLNRIKQSIAYDAHGGDRKSNAGPYKETFSYDANGNIKTLQRNLANGTLLDDLSYHYDKESNGSSRWLISNRLYHYNDAVIASATAGDLENTASSFDDANVSINTTNNFGYDEIGNLIRDESEEIDSIGWDVYGKIRHIVRTGSSTKPDLGFIYNPAGERIMKVAMTKNIDGSLTSPSSWAYTCYMRDASGNVMNTISSSNGPSNLTDEFGIYGSSRLGVWSPNAPATYLDGLNARGDEYRIAGDKMYELSNHLGNVMVVVSDKKLGIDNNADGKANAYYADVVSANDYYAFGMPMPGRSYSSPSYRYGFNGKEKDDEAKGSGNSIDFGARIYDPRLGRWQTHDNVLKPWLSPYEFGKNNPVNMIDPDGNDEFHFHFYMSDKGVKCQLEVVRKDGRDEFYSHKHFTLVNKETRVASDCENKTQFYPFGKNFDQPAPRSGLTSTRIPFLPFERNDNDYVTLLKYASQFPQLETIVKSLGYGNHEKMGAIFSDATKYQGLNILTRGTEFLASALMLYNSVTSFFGAASATTGTVEATQSIKSTFSINEGLFQGSITTEAGEVGMLAETVTENAGQTLHLKDIAIYGVNNQGKAMQGGEVGSQIFQGLKSLKEWAKGQGFKELRLTGERVANSSSANPGMKIDKIIKLD